MRFVFLSILVCVSAAVNPIIVKGQYLYDSVTNERFYLKGLTYGYSTEEGHKQNWEPAMRNISKINPEINTVRIYRINPPISQSAYVEDPSAPTPPPTPAIPTPAPCTCGSQCSPDPNVLNGKRGFCGAGCWYETNSPEGTPPPAGTCCYANCGGSAAPVYEVKTNYKPFMEEMMRLNLHVMVPLTPAGEDLWKYCVLNRAGTPPLGDQSCYPSCLLSYAMAIINEFGGFPNTLMYVIGNEVLDSPTHPEHMISGQCIKAFARDVKAYMLSCDSLRLVPTMYSAADRPLKAMDGTLVDPNTANLRKAQYLGCGPWHSRVDIFGMNVYRWCNPVKGECIKSADKCGWGTLGDKLTGLNALLIMSEYGCPWGTKARDWAQLEVLYGKNHFGDWWSGGTAYAYGITGGPEFAMFSGPGAGRGENDFPGFDKHCSDDGECNVDNFNKSLSLYGPTAVHTPLDGPALSCSSTHPDPRKTDGSKWTDTPPACPHLGILTPAMGMWNNLTHSRWHAPGWVGINCPATSRIPAEDQAREQTVKSCYAPTKICQIGNVCATCPMYIPFPGFPECHVTMKWISHNYLAQNMTIDGSSCSFQTTAAAEGKCPPVDTRYSCNADYTCTCTHSGGCSAKKPSLVIPSNSKYVSGASVAKITFQAGDYICYAQYSGLPPTPPTTPQCGSTMFRCPVSYKLLNQWGDLQTQKNLTITAVGDDVHIRAYSCNNYFGHASESVVARVGKVVPGAPTTSPTAVPTSLPTAPTSPPTTVTSPTTAASPTAATSPTTAASPTTVTSPTTAASPTAVSSPTTAASPTTVNSPTAATSPTTAASPTAATSPTTISPPTAAAEPTVKPTAAVTPTSAVAPTTAISPTAAKPTPATKPTNNPPTTAEVSGVPAVSGFVVATFSVVFGVAVAA